SMTEHHAILDGWSVASVLTELFKQYFCCLAGDTGAPAPPANRFRDFVALEREALASTDAQRYWREKLGDATMTALFRWPADNPDSATSQNHVVEVGIPFEVAEGLRQLARS